MLSAIAARKAAQTLRADDASAPIQVAEEESEETNIEEEDACQKES